MNNTFTIVCATKKDKIWNKVNCPMWELPLLNNVNGNYTNAIVYNNKKGLPEIYNSYFDKLDTDFIICVHDDVIIDDVRIFDKIEEYSKLYDIMGVAGGCNFSFKRHARLSWMSVIDQKIDLAGSVNHRMSKEGDIPELFSTSCYGLCPRRAYAIDGLIMIFNKKAYKSIKFDEQFMFDFYDLDICFSAYKEKLKVGVIPLAVTHYSKGEGILVDKYLVEQKKFTDKWLK